MKKSIIILALLFISAASFAQKKQLILTNLTPFKVVEKEVLIQKAHYDYIYTPPTWETRTQKILVTPIRDLWKKTSKRRSCLGAPGEICYQWVLLRDIPPQFKTIAYQGLLTPAVFEVRQVPAQYRKIQQAVIETEVTTLMMEDIK